MTSEIAVSEQNKNQSIGDMIKDEKIKAQFATALPHFLTLDKFLRVSMTCIRGNPKLAQCTPVSLLSAMIQSASLGLLPDPILGQAYLIPYGTEATFMVGYKGLVALARRSGEVASMSVNCVYKNDKFDMILGTKEELIHRPITEGERGEFLGAYAVVQFKDGGHQMDFMTKADIDKIRKISKASNSPAWSGHYPEMAKKVVFKRLSKYLTLSSDYQQAIALDDKAEMLALGNTSFEGRSVEEIEADFNEEDKPTEVIISPDNGCTKDSKTCTFDLTVGQDVGCKFESGEYFNKNCPYNPNRRS